MGKKEFKKRHYTTEIARCIGLFVVFVRSLKSPHTEILKKTLLCVDKSDLTSPTSNQISDIHIAVSIVYDTLKKITACVSILYIIIHTELLVAKIKSCIPAL